MSPNETNEKPQKQGRTLLALHLLLMAYSTSSILSKLAAGQPFLSLGFCACYAGILGLLGVYAIGWQQIIKRLPLTTAFANKAVTVVWGIVWGALVFHEQITPGKLAGAALVVAGVALYATADDGADASKADGETPQTKEGSTRE